MLRGQCPSVIRACSRRAFVSTAKFSSSSSSSSIGPNAPLELDPSLRALLRDADMALLKHKPRESLEFGSSSAKELEVLEFDEAWSVQLTEREEEAATPTERKSFRARFGSRNIGSVFLSAELREAIERVINDGDKPRLHEDAKRLFQDQDQGGNGLWHTTYETDYKSWKQARRHAERDGTAFASVALPAHYSVVYAVLDNIKHRLGEEWKVRSVIDWGSAVGSGFWASMHAFQETSDEEEAVPKPDALLSQSTISSYLGIERRDALTSMAKKLIEGSDTAHTTVRWRKGYPEAEQAERTEDGDILALSAFYLSSLQNSVAKKDLIKQMWSSGANVIVLIDHDTSAGFISIAEAREQLLRLGRKELQDPALQHDPASGCHVVAPCPHDGACPLLNSGKSNLQCSFSQRLQRPAFLRRTKHVRAGHEDIGYSYVAIRRGKRPSLHQTSATDGALHQSEPVGEDPVDRIRLEAYDWPRMVFPPLKRSGHVIIDGCTLEGKIMRMTIPRSQGKQPYYDARKSSWGDIFPHKPKNPPQVRLVPKDIMDDSSSLPGSDIGKRRKKDKTRDPTSYEKIMLDIKESEKKRRRDWSKSANIL
ncbi:RSM22 [Sanghuangporus sanghuang]